MSDDRYVKACDAADVALNTSHAVTVNGLDLLVCNTKDGFFTVENLCSHQLQKLEGGKIKACYIFCPVHGQRFNLKDGSTFGQLTKKPIKTFATKILEDGVWVEMPA